ncbi:hypothetical protein CKM354_000559100 [Cercospora kikuchii]|uniref:Uncharacterized protein n=1 Tax=Cercospora kikuchii TaxID=84275 RepID=A0A9P3FCH4_9PEZI|nr:uncharacterized protein CKM354_000559100 [Cercospora kikuchii]GIZ42316.1 hypothetical protein CKM354_000559100 [Cercospora kikuchii]
MSLAQSMWATEAPRSAPAVRAPPAPAKPRTSAITTTAPPPTSAAMPTASAALPRAAAVTLAVSNTTNTATTSVRTPSPLASDPRLPQLHNPHSAALAEAKAAAAMFKTSGGAKGEFAARKAQPRARAEFGHVDPPMPRPSTVPSTSFSFARPPPAPPVRITPAPAPPAPREDPFVKQALANLLAQEKKPPVTPKTTPETDHSPLMTKKHARQEEERVAVASRATEMPVEEKTKESLMKNEISPILPPHKRVKGTGAVDSLSKPVEARVSSPSTSASPVPPPKNWGQTMEAFKKNLLDKAVMAKTTPTADVAPISVQYDTAGATMSATIAPVDPTNAEHKNAALEAERALAAQMGEAAKRQKEDTKAVLQQSEKVVSQPKVAKMSEAEYGSKAAKLLIEKERVKQEREKLDKAEEDINARLEALTKTFLGV